MHKVLTMSIVQKPKKPHKIICFQYTGELNILVTITNTLCKTDSKPEVSLIFYIAIPK